jgi:hypothetical protein
MRLQPAPRASAAGWRAAPATGPELLYCTVRTYGPTFTDYHVTVTGRSPGKSCCCHASPPHAISILLHKLTVKLLYLLTLPSLLSSRATTPFSPFPFIPSPPPSLSTRGLQSFAPSAPRGCRGSPGPGSSWSRPRTPRFAFRCLRRHFCTTGLLAFAFKMHLASIL